MKCRIWKYLARLRVMEGERGKDDASNILRKQNESLNHQLEMVILIIHACSCNTNSVSVVHETRGKITNGSST